MNEAKLKEVAMKNGWTEEAWDVHLAVLKRWAMCGFKHPILLTRDEQRIMGKYGRHETKSSREEEERNGRM